MCGSLTETWRGRRLREVTRESEDVCGDGRVPTVEVVEGRERKKISKVFVTHRLYTVCDNLHAPTVVTRLFWFRDGSSTNRDHPSTGSDTTPVDGTRPSNVTMSLLVSLHFPCPTP